MLYQPVFAVAGEELIGVAVAPSWKGPYSLLTGDPIVTPPPWCIAGYAEDPFLWRSHRGYHMLLHGMCYAVFNAIVVFSEDGYNWTPGVLPPYLYLVNYTDADAALYWRVERPQLVFGGANGTTPLYLMNGVCGDGLQCLENPGKTWTLSRPIQS